MFWNVKKDFLTFWLYSFSQKVSQCLDVVLITASQNIFTLESFLSFFVCFISGFEFLTTKQKGDGGWRLVRSTSLQRRIHWPDSLRMLRQVVGASSESTANGSDLRTFLRPPSPSPLSHAHENGGFRRPICLEFFRMCMHDAWNA